MKSAKNVVIKVSNPAVRSGVIVAAQHRTTGGRMRHRGDRRAKDARRWREAFGGW